jgi:coenzyme F420-reducing hydrogenase delta subunit
MNKIIISLVALSVSFGLVANAQIQGDEQNIKAGSVNVQMNAAKAGLIKVTYPKLATSSKAVKETLEKVKIEREAFKTKMEAAKEEIKTKREQEKEALKVRLQDIKSAAKKVTIQKLDENMNKLNSNFVEKFTKNLTDFDTYLSRLVDKASATSTASKDMTAFNSTVESARTAIVAARTAVEAQSKKTYGVTFSTEVNLRSDVASIKGILNNDLKLVRDLVQAAHLATVKVLTEFNKIK